jgi:hypothetical protein
MHADGASGSASKGAEVGTKVVPTEGQRSALIGAVIVAAMLLVASAVWLSIDRASALLLDLAAFAGCW